MAIRVSWRKHKQKDGEVILYGRFKIPVRTGEGKIEHRYTERSTGTGEKLKARQRVEDIYQEAYEEAHKPREDEVDSDTFSAAAISYMKNKGSQKSPVDGLIPASRLKVRANKRYLYPIIERIGTKKLSEIDQAVVGNLATELYPGCTAATINRQLHTPIIAVMTFVGHTHDIKRPDGHDNLPPELRVPANEWYPAVLRAANPYARAFTITVRLTGRRPDELLNRTRDHFNDELGTLTVWDGKGKQYIVLTLPEPALIAIRALPDLSDAKKGSIKKGEKLTHAKRSYLFGTNQKSTMRKWMKDACKDAGVPYHTAYEAGRHAFVTKNLEEGKSLKWVMDAGRWKRIKVPAERYGHLERQDVDRQARQSGEEWFRKVLSQPVEIDAQPIQDQPLLGGVLGDGAKRA